MRVLWILLVAAGLTLPIAALSRVPYTPAHADSAVLRLSWRMNVRVREQCRPRTPEELADLPVHMRTPEVCSRDRASYMIVTRFDGATPDTMHLLRGGVKADRPLFVLEERVVPPGDRRVSVQALRVNGTAGTTVLASLDTVLTLRRGAVQLITMDRDGGNLVVRGSGTGGPRR